MLKTEPLKTWWACPSYLSLKSEAKKHILNWKTTYVNASFAGIESF